MNARKFVTIVTCAFLLSGSLHGATDREKALVNRYITVMVHSLEHIDDEMHVKFRQEPMILGCIAYYYYRESDPEFAELLRGLAWSLIRKSETTFEAEFPVFEKNFTAPKSEDDAITILYLWGFDEKTARTIVADARADRLKKFKNWMEAASVKK